MSIEDSVPAVETFTAVDVEDTSDATPIEGAPLDTQRPEWLPEKFSSPEDMATAYGELEKKIGEPKAPPSLEIPEPVADEVAPAGDSPKEMLGEELFGRIEEHYQENGVLDADLYAELAEKGLPKNVVDSFIEGQQVRAERYETDVTSIVGGKEQFTQLQQWAGENLTDAERNSVNESITSGDVVKAQMAVNWLSGKYADSEGSQPNLVEGGVSKLTGDVFTDREDLSQAQTDPRYTTSERYRKEVQAKLERSTYWRK
jgi:hypothetical protein